MTASPRFVALALTALLLATAVCTLTGAAAERPAVLRVDEVVRLHAAGVDDDELIETIRSRPVDFDLSPEMLEELERAGISERVLVQMQRRQARMAPAAPPESATDADDGHDSGATLRVVLNPKKKKGKGRDAEEILHLRIYDRIDAGLADHWKLGNAPETMRFSDVAVFLACRTPDHVADGWRTRTPLLWSAPQTPRHRMLAYLDGARWSRTTLGSKLGMKSRAGSGPEGRVEAPAGDDALGVLDLELPAAIEVPLAPGVAHDLSIGIALEVAGTAYPWIVASLDAVVLDEDGLSLEARIKGLSRPGLASLDIDFGETERRTWVASKVCVGGCSGPARSP